MPKLTQDLKVSQVFADSKQDYVFDMHIAQKHNANSMNAFVQQLSKYFKQSQANEFLVTPLDVNGTSNQDSNLIQVTKAGTLYSVTTTYNKVFSGVLVYDSSGLQQPGAVQISFALNVDNSENREIIKIQFVAAITDTYRIVLI